jgi:late competence protein required for DNA uptake (superfamily II DNA/RNA helicase)
VALATYLAACQHWPGVAITLQQGARVIEDSPANAVCVELGAKVQNVFETC